MRKLADWIYAGIANMGWEGELSIYDYATNIRVLDRRIARIDRKRAALFEKRSRLAAVRDEYRQAITERRNESA